MNKNISIILSLVLLFSVFSFSEKANAETDVDTLSVISSENENEFTDMPMQRSISDGSEAFELGFIIANGLFNTSTTSWHQGSFDFPAESIVYHYTKHGKSVGATSAKSYLNKSIEYRRTAKKNARVSNVSGVVYGTKRYSKNGRYIDLAPDGRIVSFGTTN